MCVCAQESVVLAGQSGAEEMVSRLEAERIHLHRDLQRCMYEIQQRDLYFQQLNTKVPNTDRQIQTEVLCKLFVKYLQTV